MYGEDGWCRACGIPNRPQCGPLTLQRSGLTVSGAWTPYWVYGTICLTSALAEEVTGRFRVDLRDVAWPKTPAGDVRQIVVPVVGTRWFDPDELQERATARHGSAGARCKECGVWRWMPLGFAPVPQLGSEVLPAVLDVPELEDVDVAASPEWFGDGGKSFRELLVRREFAEMLVQASPRDFRIVEPEWVCVIRLRCRAWLVRGMSSVRPAGSALVAAAEAPPAAGARRAPGQAVESLGVTHSLRARAALRCSGRGRPSRDQA